MNHWPVTRVGWVEGGLKNRCRFALMRLRLKLGHEIGPSIRHLPLYYHIWNKEFHSVLIHFISLNRLSL